MMTTTSSPHTPASENKKAITRIAVGVDGYPEGRDAAALGAALARATGAELILVGVHPDPLILLPEEMNWKGMREQAKAAVRDVRETLAPEARIAVETDLSVPRALHRIIQRDRCDLLVVGSSRHASEGRVRIGKRTRQLLCHFECALAIAPRGLHTFSDPELARIGVGYDGSPESERALALAGSIALAAGAELRVCSVVDDRLPAIGWGYVWIGEMIEDWREAGRDELRALRERAIDAAGRTGASARFEAVTGRPADALLALSSEVDLLVIGSRRWGPAARVLLGSTGEALAHDASCPLVTVPRP